jgi:hypothetical protein
MLSTLPLSLKKKVALDLLHNAESFQNLRLTCKRWNVPDIVPDIWRKIPIRYFTLFQGIGDIISKEEAFCCGIVPYKGCVNLYGREYKFREGELDMLYETYFVSIISTCPREAIKYISFFFFHNAHNFFAKKASCGRIGLCLSEKYGAFTNEISVTMMYVIVKMTPKD